jgi:hypothetical protein
MSYSVYADYLYWKVERSGLDTYDYHSEGRNRGHACPDYHSGFRVGGAVHCDCWDFGVRYTWFQVDSKKNRGHYRLSDWNRVDLEAGYSWRLDCADVSFRPFAGAIFLWVDEKFNDGYDYEHSKLDYKGYGLYIGSDAEWHIANYCDTDVALVTRGAFGVIDGRFKLNDSYSRGNECVYNPYIEVFAGLKLTMNDVCGCYSPDIIIGYEVQHYGSWRKFWSPDDLSSIGLGGLVVRLGLGF